MAWPRTSRHTRGYGTAHDKMRAHLLATVILCEECTRQGRVTAGHIADHIKPLAEGGTGERSNYQLLCQDCSDVKTAEENGRRHRGASDANGMPTDPTHPWNVATASR